MFEKEAEELIEESKRLNTTPRETVRKAIEFGYNKCFEQIKNIVYEDTRLDCIIPELLRLHKKENTNETGL